MRFSIHSCRPSIRYSQGDHPILAEKVNLVNAPLLLKERQIDLVASTLSAAKSIYGVDHRKGEGHKRRVLSVQQVRL